MFIYVEKVVLTIINLINLSFEGTFSCFKFNCESLILDRNFEWFLLNYFIGFRVKKYLINLQLSCLVLN